jgi:hypothetical protein
MGERDPAGGDPEQHDIAGAIGVLEHLVRDTGKRAADVCSGKDIAATRGGLRRLRGRSGSGGGQGSIRLSPSFPASPDGSLKEWSARKLSAGDGRLGKARRGLITTVSHKVAETVTAQDRAMP